MSERTTHEDARGPVLVAGEPALVVDATAAALRGHGVDARAVRAGGEDGPAPADRADPADPVHAQLVLLVPAGAEAAFRAAATAGRAGLVWGAVVDGRQDARGEATVDALREAGASWVLGADAGLDAVVEALAGAVRGPAPGEAPAVRTTGDGADDRSPAARLASLTARERAALEAMAEGRTVAESATMLDSTEATVRAHRRSVRAKLGVRSQLAAVALLFRQQAEDRADDPGPAYAPETSSRRGGLGSTRVATVPGPASGPGAAVPNLA